MKKNKVLIDFSRFSDPELATYAQSIVNAMTGNPNFLTPTPPLPDLTTAITAYNSAMTEAYTGDHAATEVKNQKRELLEGVLHDLGLYVEVQSAGDTAIMLGSGFKISKDWAPVGPLPKPTGFCALPFGKGEIKLGLDKLQGANAYQFEYKETTAADWTRKMSTKTKVLLTDLPSGKEYFFRVLPIGASDVREYSDEISSFVL